MTTVEIRGVRFHYRVDGAPGAPPLVLSNSLGTNLAMWDAQIPEFSKRFRVVRYDSRGHGASSVTPEPYTIEQLARDVVALLDALDIERAHFCGLSIGGMVGMWLGANAPERIERLVLCNTSAKIPSPETYNARIDAVRKNSIASIADAVLERWLTAAFREHTPEAAGKMRAMLVSTDVEGYAATCAAVRDMDQRDALSRIKRPTLVIAGAHDIATPPGDARRIVGSIAGASYVELDAAHISNVEAAAAFSEAVVDFLTR